MLPGNVSVFPGHRTMLPGNVSVFPGYRTMLPGNVNVFLGYRTMLPEHVIVVLGYVIVVLVYRPMFPVAPAPGAHRAHQRAVHGVPPELRESHATRSYR